VSSVPLEIYEVKQKLAYLFCAWRIGARLRDKLSLMLAFLRYGGLLKYPTIGKVESIKTTLAGAKQLHWRTIHADGILLRELLIDGEYESLATLQFQPKVIWDVGANIGLGSFVMRQIFPDAQLFGFEPSPKDAAIVRLNYGSWGKATHFEVAVGRQDHQQVSFATDENRSGGQHVSTAVEADWNQTPVTLRRLDAMVQDGSITPPDLVKMDIEGFEVEALLGMGDYLATPRAYILETHSDALHQECLTLLGNVGFRVVQDFPRYGGARILCMAR